MAQLYFYYSAMNAGKSTTLLQSAHNYRERGMETLLYTPAIDTRAGTPKIHSRIGISADAIAFGQSYDFF
jgi:thymidine kinase